MEIIQQHWLDKKAWNHKLPEGCKREEF